MINQLEITTEVDAILKAESEKSVILKRICSLLQEKVYHYDWVGFYELNAETNTLMLGEFVGKPTEHTQIAVGKGVCGQVAENKSTMIVQDVTSIDNYISCSIDVQSEIVAPVLKDGNFVAEIDIDSHATAPFTNEDQELLETICAKIAHLF